MIFVIVVVEKNLKNAIENKMYSIKSFEDNIKDKSKIESLDYALKTLVKAEEILIDTKACKDTYELEKFIEFLKLFINKDK